MELEEPSPEALLLITAEQDLEAAVEVQIKEELVEEVMQQLYREIHSEAPSSAATASFLGGRGSESCGASVSDSASSVMAGVEPVGPAGRGSLYWWGCIDGPAMVVGDGVADRDHNIDDPKRQIRRGMVMNGCDEEGEGDQEDPDDDEWLARVLSWGPVEVDPFNGF